MNSWCLYLVTVHLSYFMDTCYKVLDCSHCATCFKYHTMQRVKNTLSDETVCRIFADVQTNLLKSMPFKKGI